MTSLFLRGLFFAVLNPGIVAGLIPVLITKVYTGDLFSTPLNLNHIIGSTLFLIGFIILSICIVDFAVIGRGTLSPADPTKKLVHKGLYQYSRNPMYVGVIVILLGEIIFTQSILLLIYALAIFTIFNIFIIFFEEPRLKKDFQEAYIHYCEKVRRWL